MFTEISIRTASVELEALVVEAQGFVETLAFGAMMVDLDVAACRAESWGDAAETAYLGRCAPIGEADPCGFCEDCIGCFCEDCISPRDLL